MKKHDLNYIAAVEKAIGKKYGDEAVSNPRSGWTEEKEELYKLELEKLNKKKDKQAHEEYEEVKCVLIQKKLINKRKQKFCSQCETKIKNLNDDTSYTKYETCFKCYIEYIEHREERWQQGWRPKNVTSNTRNNSGTSSSCC